MVKKSTAVVLRRGELLRLTLADVDAQAGVLRIRESKFHNYAAFLAMPIRLRLDRDDAGK
jgi:integrase